MQRLWLVQIWDLEEDIKNILGVNIWLKLKTIIF